jgi:hypothetical protein
MEKKKYVAASPHFEGASWAVRSGMGSVKTVSQYMSKMRVARHDVRVRPSANLTSTGFSIALKALK